MNLAVGSAEVLQDLFAGHARGQCGFLRGGSPGSGNGLRHVGRLRRWSSHGRSGGGSDRSGGGKCGGGAAFGKEPLVECLEDGGFVGVGENFGWELEREGGPKVAGPALRGHAARGEQTDKNGVGADSNRGDVVALANGNVVVLVPAKEFRTEALDGTGGGFIVQERTEEAGALNHDDGAGAAHVGLAANAHHLLADERWLIGLLKDLFQDDAIVLLGGLLLCESSAAEKRGGQGEDCQSIQQGAFSKRQSNSEYRAGTESRQVSLF